AEIYSQGAAVFGLNPFQDTVVLDQTFNDVDLVGHPLTVGNFVSSNGIGALAYASVTNTYTPYLEIGDDAFPNPSQDQVITGQSYQEVLTNFPLASQVLTGLFLNVTLYEPEAPSQTYSHTILNRIGFAAREGLATTNVSIDPSGPPALNDLDTVTLLVAASGQSIPATLTASNSLEQLTQQLDTITTTQAGTGNTVAAHQLAGQQDNLSRLVLTESEATLGSDFLVNANHFTGVVASNMLVRSYYVSPCLLAVSNTSSSDQITGTVTSQVAIDIMRNDTRAYAAPQQVVSTEPVFRFISGTLDSMLEGQLLGSSSAGITTTSSFDTFSKAVAQGAGMVTITTANLAQLSSLNLSPDAMARITDAVLASSFHEKPYNN
ncbi:MAG: hypothetical protein WA746_14865, partial [Isosphaeraceae bacterium]